MQFGFETFSEKCQISQNISGTWYKAVLVCGLAGIVFFRTTMLQEIVEFYVTDIGMHVWLEQDDCIILSHGNLLLG